MNKFRAGLIISCFSVSAQADLVFLEPLSAQPTYRIGEVVALDLKIDFTDGPTIGGGVDLFFDPSGLKFKSWTAELLGDATFRRSPDELSGELNGIAFGDFAGLPLTAKVGTVEFIVLQTGSWLVDLEANDAPAGPFYSATDSSLLSVQYADTTVIAHQVPIPSAALWLFGSAVLAFTTLSHKRTA